jgi:hypothetical protein
MRSALSIRTLAALALVAVAALPLAGCGETPQHRFRNQLRPLTQLADEQKAQIAATLKMVHRHNKADAQLLSNEIASLGRTVRKIGFLVVPSVALKPFVSYNLAYRRLVQLLQQFTNVLYSGSKAQLDAVANQAKDAAGAVQEADIALQHALGPVTG